MWFKSGDQILLFIIIPGSMAAGKKKKSINASHLDLLAPTQVKKARTNEQPEKENGGRRKGLHKLKSAKYAAQTEGSRPVRLEEV